MTTSKITAEISAVRGEIGGGDEGNPSHRVFHNLATPKSSLYRATLRLFVEAKERFEIALRPPEILLHLSNQGLAFSDLNETEVIACLESLCEWGNLTATRDVVSARTVEEYPKRTGGGQRNGIGLDRILDGCWGQIVY